MSDSPPASGPQPDSPHPPYAQPQDPSRPMAYPPAGDRTQPATGAGASSGGTLGRTAFVIAAVAVALGLLFTTITPLILTNVRTPAVYEFLALLRAVIGLALGTAALILGIVAARRRSQPVLAGIAIGVGAVEILATVTALASSFLYTVLY
ncbi:hypothetical protein [Microbacterium sp. NPDC058345]|uniref:hypothetical protein n=1 Tax=Microbacterium sp. NPDC058345 TaxID=3346455 RepID=UPI00364E2786